MKIKRIISAIIFFFVSGVYGDNADKLQRNIGVGQKPASFNEMVIRHAKRLCNGGLYRDFQQDGRDFVDFWFTAKEVNLDLEKAYTCLRLFYNNIKAAEAIDDTVVDQVLEAMPRFFNHYFDEAPVAIGELNIVRQNVEDLLLERFTDQFDLFQIEPDIFINKISTDISGIVKSRLMYIHQEEDARELKEKFRTMIVRFSDLIISKAIWYEEYHERIWTTVTSIADSLHKMGTRGIITDQDNLDELWDTLVKRFVWYLDFRGSALPMEFYDQVEEDLKNNVQLFLELDEQDDGITTKKEAIQGAIIKAKAKVIALEKGIVTDSMR